MDAPSDLKTYIQYMMNNFPPPANPDDFALQDEFIGKRDILPFTKFL
jgi:hypothetical protein